MSEGHGRKPLLRSRGLILIEDFCRAAGVDPASIEGLLRSGIIDGVADGQDRPFGLFDDVLPTPQQLRSLGVNVSSDYDFNQLRGVELDSDKDPEEAGNGQSTWTMSWGDDPSS